MSLGMLVATCRIAILLITSTKAGIKNSLIVLTVEPMIELGAFIEWRGVTQGGASKIVE